MKDHFTEIQFLGEDRRRRKGNPDLLVDGVYIDIKSPEKKRRIGERLVDAATQCRNRGQSGGVAILNPLRLEDGAEICERVARNKVNRGQLKTVYVLGADSSVTVV